MNSFKNNLKQMVEHKARRQQKTEYPEETVNISGDLGEDDLKRNLFLADPTGEGTWRETDSYGTVTSR